MTLLLTEIHNHDDPAHATIVFAADRRISVGSRYHGSRKKIFAIPCLNAAIGYFGLAQVGCLQMADWLPAHLRRDRSLRSLGDFAENLADRLNADVPLFIDVPSSLDFTSLDSTHTPVRSFGLCAILQMTISLLVPMRREMTFRVAMPPTYNPGTSRYTEMATFYHTSLFGPPWIKRSAPFLTEPISDV
jgi:hypothetical protein